MDIIEYIKQNYSDYIELIKTLTKINAPSGKEEERVSMISKWLSDHDIDSFVDECNNVIITTWFDEANNIIKDTRLIMAHTDTVFNDNQNIEIVEDDNRISAPGVGDDTANVAAIMMACKFMIKNNKTLPISTLIVLNSCEEGLGNLKGCRAVMEKYGKRIYEMTSFDLGYDKIRVSAVGSSRYEVQIKTEGGHSYFDFGKENAIYHAAKLIANLYEIDTTRCEGINTFNVGKINGGTSVNTIAPHATFLFEVRSETGEGLNDLKEQFINIIDTYVNNYKAVGINIEVTCIGERPSAMNLDMVAQRQLIDRGKNLIYDVTGHVPVEESASTDCNIPLSMGIPSICMGSYIGALEHTTYEYIEKSSLEKGLEIVTRWILNSF